MVAMTAGVGVLREGQRHTEGQTAFTGFLPGGESVLPAPNSRLFISAAFSV